MEKKVSSGENSKERFPEHSFLSSCLRVGLTMNDLEKITFIDAMKILISYLPEKEIKKREATQADWDRLAGRR